MSVQTFREQIADQLAAKLEALPKQYRQDEMAACLRIVEATGADISADETQSPEKFARLLLSSLSLGQLTSRSLRNATEAESPQALVLAILPSDGHLD